MPTNPSYKIEKVPIGTLLNNPSNPRTISDSKFKSLVESIQKAPWMLKLRPIVINKHNIILGGNQRYKACVKAGLDHVWVINADKISDDQQRRFILRDNVDFGKWDIQILRNQYKESELLSFGLEIELMEREAPKADETIKQPAPMGDDDAVEPNIPAEELEQAKKNFNDTTIKQIVFQLPSDIYEEAVKDLDNISKELDCDDNSEVLLRLLNFYEVCNGLEFSDNDPDEGESREDEDGQTSD